MAKTTNSKGSAGAVGDTTAAATVPGASTGLTTTTANEALPAFINKADAERYGSKTDAVAFARIHLCQDRSPEVNKHKIASTGDLVTRPTGINIGQGFRAVVLDVERLWVRWGNKQHGDPEADWGRILWSGRKRDLTPAQAKETVWPKDGKPKATETYNFLVCEIGNDGSINPSGLGALFINMDRTSFKVGENLDLQLKAQAAKGWPPFCCIVEFKSCTIPIKNVGDVQGWSARVVDTVKDEPSYLVLKGLADMVPKFKQALRDGAVDDGTIHEDATTASAKAAVRKDVEDPPF